MKKYIVAGTLFMFPVLVFAQNLSYVTNILNIIKNLVGLATPVVIGLAMLFFLYGLMKFILASGDEEAKETGKRIMIWGIVALFVMVSVWGLVNLLQNNLNVGSGTITTPQVP